MFVIPAAGPGENQLPDMSVLDGLVSDGPQEPSASAPSASNSNLEDREGNVIEREEWALQDSNLRPSDYESAALTN
jgi:hypothetical protein